MRIRHHWMGSVALLSAMAGTPTAMAQPATDEPPAASDEEAPEVLEEDGSDDPATETASPSEELVEERADDVEPSEPPEAPASVAPAPTPVPVAAPPPGMLANDTRYFPVRPEPEPVEPEPVGPYVPHWMSAELGVRNCFILHDGFEPYADNQFLAQAAFTFNVLPFHIGDFAFGLSGEYDVGRRTHDIRGIESAMTLHRLGAGVHAQALLGRLRLFARVTPGAWHTQGTITDTAFERPLVSNGWTWGVDTTAGLAVRIGSAGGPSNDRAVRFWLLAEFGYGFAGEVEMSYSPEEDEEDPRTYGSVNLPPLRPKGLVNRLGLALSF